MPPFSMAPSALSAMKAAASSQETPARAPSLRTSGVLSLLSPSMKSIPKRPFTQSVSPLTPVSYLERTLESWPSRTLMLR